MGSSAGSCLVLVRRRGAVRFGAAARHDDASGLSAEDVEARWVVRRLLLLVDGAGLSEGFDEGTSFVARRFLVCRGVGMVVVSGSGSESGSVDAWDVVEVLEMLEGVSGRCRGA
jgi:hypothetical protein